MSVYTYRLQLDFWLLIIFIYKYYDMDIYNMWYWYSMSRWPYQDSGSIIGTGTTMRWERDGSPNRFFLFSLKPKDCSQMLELMCLEGRPHIWSIYRVQIMFTPVHTSLGALLLFNGSFGLLIHNGEVLASPRFSLAPSSSLVWKPFPSLLVCYQVLGQSTWQRHHWDRIIRMLHPLGRQQHQH